MSAGRHGLARTWRSAVALTAVAGLSLLLTPMAEARPAEGIVAGILPVAVNDSTTVVHGRTRTVAAPGVLANDLQVGDGFTARLVAGPSNGSLDLDADGGYTYTADLDFVGEDTFRYRVDGGLLGLSNTATVRIAVTNEPPVARADAYAAVAGVERIVPAPGILGNDDDGDGDALTIDVVQQPAGELAVGADGRVRYTADIGFTGVDTFTYRVSDGAAWSSAVQVRFTVTAPPATPSPSPSPTPSPTPAATPRPTPTPAGGSPTPTPGGSATPAPTTDATPTGPPVGSSPPGASDPAAPTDRPTSQEPSVDPSPGSGAIPPGAGPPGGGSTLPGAGIDLAIDPNRAEFDFATVEMAFDGFEWAVPGLVLTVPGLLLMLAVALQSITAIGWLRLTRRSLGGDRRADRPDVSDR